MLRFVVRRLAAGLVLIVVLSSLAYLLLDRPMQKRFQSDARFQATMLLLQERIPRSTAVYLESAGRFDARAETAREARGAAGGVHDEPGSDRVAMQERERPSFLAHHLLHAHLAQQKVNSADEPRSVFE